MICVECGQESPLCLIMPINFETNNLNVNYSNIQGDKVCIGCVFLLGIDILQDSKIENKARN